jgi:hypothetical protein
LWYGGTGTGRDASASAETSGFVPTRAVVEMLGLSNGRDFRWQGADGLAVQDPSAAMGGPGSLLLQRDLAARLRVEGGMTVFWTVLVGRELHQPDHRPADDYRWVSASASYVLEDDTVRKVHSVATRCRPGPATELEVAWPVRATDRDAGGEAG